MCNFMSYEVEIANRDFSKAAAVMGHMKVVRSGKSYHVIETNRHDRSMLTRNGISFTLVMSKDEDEED